MLGLSVRDITNGLRIYATFNSDITTHMLVNLARCESSAGAFVFTLH